MSTASVIFPGGKAFRQWRWLLMAVLCGCSTRSVRPNVTVRAQDEIVRLERSSEVTAFTVTTVVTNDEASPIYISECSHRGQRLIDGTWTTLFVPSCVGVQEPTVIVAPGESLVVPVRVAAYTTTPPTIPMLDPRMVAGEYRILFTIGFGAPPLGSTDPPSSQQNRLEEIASTTFIVRD